MYAGTNVQNKYLLIGFAEWCTPRCVCEARRGLFQSYKFKKIDSDSAEVEEISNFPGEIFKIV